ncbi:MAG: DUF2207 domain-containing protein [Candidatus Saccharibacteria bacterium]|nr:DUF2207 domain-containing protein [Candidatus Saccharibacteria bacterium]
MKRIYVRLALGLIISLFFVGFIPHNAGASVNDFSFSSFDADYYLSKDTSGHSTMKVVERLTAEFQNQNQNKGIERAIPSHYDGHSVSFSLLSLTRNGQPEPVFEQKQSGEFEVVSTGTNEYVNGTQKYVFTYILHDVTKNFGDHQELYWDTNGTGWDQSFGTVTARVHLDDSVKNAFTGDVSCYQGAQLSKEKCESEIVGSEVTFNSTRALSGHENLTFDLSFKAGTFAGYRMTIADMIPYIFIAIAAVLSILMIVIKVMYGRNNPGRGTIVPEYLPPKDTSVLLSAEIFDKPNNSSTAQIIDLAVRHKIRIEETEKDAFIGKTKEYSVELLSVDGLNQDELGFVDLLFSGHQIGSKYIFSKNDVAMAMKMKSLVSSVKDVSISYGYRLKQTSKSVLQGVILLVISILAGVAIYMAISSENSIPIAAGTALFVILAILLSVFKVASMNPLTPSGRELFDYLKGLKTYIKLAEADRLKVLQSAEGAERKQIDTSSGAEMIVLYERVLPYAVLFGQEKSWLKQLGMYYETNQTRPDWYSGMGTFNAIAFASAVGSFSSYAGSSSFSSSSGAGGGGFSGGGGGGGGGGGR